MDVSAIIKKMKYKEEYSSKAVNVPNGLDDLTQSLNIDGEEPEFTLLFIVD